MGNSQHTEMIGHESRNVAKCPMCHKKTDCLHRIDGRPVCDLCFAKWASRSIDANEQNAEWLVKTLHNLIIGPFPKRLLDHWLSEGILSYTSEVTFSGSHLWSPVTQDAQFSTAAERGRAKYSNSTPEVVQQKTATQERRASHSKLFYWQRAVIALIAGAIIGWGAYALHLTWKLRRQKSELQGQFQQMTEQQTAFELLERELIFAEHLQLHDYVAADAALELMRKNPLLTPDRDAYYSARLFRLSQNNVSDATVETLSEAATSASDDRFRDAATNELGLIYYRQGKKNLARETWQKLADNATNTFFKISARVNLGLAAIDETPEGEGWKYFEEALTLNEDAKPFWEPLTYLTLKFMNQKMWDQAATFNRRALSAFAFIPQNALYAATIRNELHTTQTTASDEIDTKLFSISPEILEWTLQSPHILPHPKPFESIALIYEKVDKKSAKELRDWFKKALTNLDARDEKQGYEIVKSFFKTRLKNTDSKALAGFVCWYANRVMYPISWEKTCSKLVDTRVYTVTARELINAQKFSDALSLAEKIMLMEPGNPWGLWFKAKVFFETNRVSEALIILNHGREQFPTFYPFVELLLERRVALEPLL